MRREARASLSDASTALISIIILSGRGQEGVEEGESLCFTLLLSFSKRQAQTQAAATPHQWTTSWGSWGPDWAGLGWAGQSRAPGRGRRTTRALPLQTGLPGSPSARLAASSWGGPPPRSPARGRMAWFQTHWAPLPCTHIAGGRRGDARPPSPPGAPTPGEWKGRGSILPPTRYMLAAMSARPPAEPEPKPELEPEPEPEPEPELELELELEPEPEPELSPARRRGRFSLRRLRLRSLLLLVMLLLLVILLLLLLLLPLLPLLPLAAAATAASTEGRGKGRGAG
ncbi:uncharacterized protein LOC127548025 [Antechinus flavipes]|uniref:uncharacterized protein LOC127548025 n=1 Tax=Antechinus flavipes TaxID=38775 RepID=UPI00223698C7|nr:uncharacterized protein LOC127548025 [Antechinus flavipes]